MSTESPSDLETAVAELTAIVRQQGELLARIADTLGIAEGERSVAAMREQAGDALWQRLGLAEGERRTVTVLFADVSGFTALSEHLEAEEFQLVMKDAMSAIAAIITRHDGYIEKFIGDAVCAIFGAPIAHDDEPQRAARSALEINRVLAEKAAARPDLPVIAMHAGINTGVVIAGTVGDGSQFGVMGDTINTASRLMNLAQQDEIFVSAETSRRLRREFVVEDRGIFEVKGKQQPVAAYNLVAERKPDEHGDDDLLRAPFVGRDAELEELRTVAAQTAAGDGTTVVVVGEPGVGKSRLVSELIEADGDRFEVFWGSARVVGDQQTLVMDAFGRDVDARWLSSTAARKPVLVVLDDLELADAGSVELLHQLSRATRHDPISWVFVARQAPPIFDPATEGDDDLVTLRLAPLSDDEISVLFDGLLPGVLSHAQRARLAYQADGNPEFAEEIALSLIDLSVVSQSADGSFRLVGDPETLEIPSSVAELVEARMDRVSTNARVTLQDAAVIGVRFREALLQRVASIPTSVPASLAELAAAELIVEPDDEDPYWRFRSHVVREVAYESILRRRRPRLHRAIADALLELEPDRIADNVELLATHFELSNEPALAIPYLRSAVEYAEAAHSVTATAERARRALGIRAREPHAVSDEDAAWFEEHLRAAENASGTVGDR